MSTSQAAYNSKDEPMEMVDVVIGTKTYTWPRPIAEDVSAYKVVSELLVNSVFRRKSSCRYLTTTCGRV